jgi:hypothetical protein
MHPRGATGLLSMDMAVKLDDTSLVSADPSTLLLQRMISTRERAFFNEYSRVGSREGESLSSQHVTIIDLTSVYVARYLSLWLV